MPATRKAEHPKGVRSKPRLRLEPRPETGVFSPRISADFRIHKDALVDTTFDRRLLEIFFFSEGNVSCTFLSQRRQPLGHPTCESKGKGMSRWVSAAIVLASIALVGPQYRPGSQPVAEPIRSYYSNGAVRQEYTLDANGRGHGYFRAWYPDGCLERELVFSHGVWESKREWWPNGVLREEWSSSFFGDVCTRYDQDGQAIR